MKKVAVPSNLIAVVFFAVGVMALGFFESILTA
jgi:hypothetical protein